jgi:hypothetical protein
MRSSEAHRDAAAEPAALNSALKDLIDAVIVPALIERIAKYRPTDCRLQDSPPTRV